jgi:hypothetical protein
MIKPCITRLVLLPTVYCLLSTSCFAQGRPDPLKDRIDRALEFLSSQQDENGSWNSKPALTGLAVMAFLSAGHVPGEGPYAETVEKGIRWVLENQRANGLFATNEPGLEMYHHGICTLMLAEAAGMTDAKLAKELKVKLEKAVKLILQGQRPAPSIHQGGWRYRVDSPDADVSVTGWQLLALRAVKNLGCDVPSERIDQAVDYLKRCRDPITGGYCYMPGGRQTTACTGTSILAIELCGKDKERSRETLQAGSYLLKHPLRFGEEHFFYGVYYGAQAMFQLGNNYWNAYRPELHKTLFDHQQANGAWIGPDGLGPAYATAMAILALTVEYRFLPIYQRNEK